MRRLRAHDAAMSTTNVTMIGLGPMGQAMVGRLLEAGRSVTVWNRSPDRAAGAVAAGAQLAPTVAEAVEASDLVLVSLTDYPAMYEVLARATGSLEGTTLVNLSSDSPEATRQASAWAASHGAAFVAGGVMVPAPMVGTERAFVFYSGDRVAFEAHRAVLAAIGAPRFLGEDPGLAQLVYQAHLDVFLTTLAGLAHATALVGSAGISAEAFLPEVAQLVTAIPAMIASDGVDRLGARVDAGQHLNSGAQRRCRSEPGAEDLNGDVGRVASSWSVPAVARAQGSDVTSGRTRVLG